MLETIHFWRVDKPNPPLPDIVDESEVDDFTSYRAFPFSKADEWMKDVSQIVKIKRHRCDWREACKKQFGTVPFRKKYLFDPDGYEFYDDRGVFIGKLYEESLEEFNYIAEEEAYVFQYEKIAKSMETCYIRLKGLQNAETILEEALRLIYLEETYYHSTRYHELVHTLIKCYYHAVQGENICFMNESKLL